LDEKVPQQGDGFGPYGLTKAILHNYTMIAARENPSILISAVSPGFIETNMTAGFKSDSKLKPE
jgi:NAD(P)-dependent dehydrogenase (short-subunit alcohol dehydrogenase family)